MKLTDYKNIIFDLGNVIVRLNSEGCMKAFADLGLAPYLDPTKHTEGQVLMHKLGLGLISTGEFCNEVRRLSGLAITDGQIVDAANVMLAEIPHDRLDILLKLRAEGKHVFLLSNTIDMHWDYCVERLFLYDGHTVNDYFERVYLSQRMHLEKPDHRIFEEVVRATGIQPEETLFIDDLPANCDAARQSVGWNVFQNTSFDSWLTLVNDYLSPVTST